MNVKVDRPKKQQQKISSMVLSKLYKNKKSPISNPYSYTLMIAFPVLLPSNRPIKASGILSNPLVTCSLYLILPYNDKKKNKKTMYHFDYQRSRSRP